MRNPVQKSNQAACATIRDEKYETYVNDQVRTASILIDAVQILNL
jgi:hypothetical protein